MAGVPLGSDPVLGNERRAVFPPPPEQLFGPRCLAHVVPLVPGQRVLVLGSVPGLVHSVARRGATPVSVLAAASAEDELEGEVVVRSQPGQLPLPDASVDHAVVARASMAWWREERLAELARVVVSGGTLLLGCHNRTRRPSRREAQTAGTGGLRLAAAGFARPRTYGVRHGFHDPRFLVPLEHPGARQWFLDTYPPPSSRNARASGLLARAPRTVADLLFFPHLLFVAERDREPTC